MALGVLLAVLGPWLAGASGDPPLPPPVAQWDFAAPESQSPLCDRTPGSTVCLRQHNASNPVTLTAGEGAEFVSGSARRLEAPRSTVAALASIGGPNATVSIVAWIRPALGDLHGGFIGGLWDEADAARQFALYQGPMARCKTPAGVVGHISADGLPKVDTKGVACESAACGSTTVAGGEWHCVGVTYDGAAIRAYLNGTLDNASHPSYNGSSILSLNPFPYPDPAQGFPRGGIYRPGPGQVGADLAFGANYIDHGDGKRLTSVGFGGTLKAYAVWREALSSGQIPAACRLLTGGAA